ncbi:MAG TPA: M81 family metallopeptidase [Roseiflexaceae bacterium]|nr:M81 family metallopeptidase [Roseiflexaceae bacterium]
MQSSAKRVAIGGIVHETHCFAEPHTGLAAFREQGLYEGGDILKAMAGTRAGIGGMIAGAESYGWALQPTLYGTAMPGGIVADEAYQTMLRGLLDQLATALPLDGVLLALHGAMVAESQLDAESDILAHVRALVGRNVPIVVELDMHGNISPRTAELADVLVAFDTNPHIDPHARGVEAAEILDRLLRGAIRPTAAIAQPSLVLAPQATGTDDLPLRAVHQRAAEIEADGAVICVCVMGGFAYADTPFTGASIIVTTDGDQALAERYARELAELLMRNRHAALPRFLVPDAAVAQALAMPGGPIILVDSADNIGGGTPGDGTDALRAMLAADVPESAVVLADREAVATCWAAGVGAELTLPVGGKADRWHGEPVEVSGTVRALSDGVFACELPDNHFAAFYGDTIQMGRTAWLRVRGVNVVLTERKTPPFDLAQLRGVGVIPERQKLIVVKSAVAYRAAYMPIAAGVVEMDTAGLCSANLARFPYRHLRRPIVPLDSL